MVDAWVEKVLVLPGVGFWNSVGTNKWEAFYQNHKLFLQELSKTWSNKNLQIASNTETSEVPQSALQILAGYTL